MTDLEFQESIKDLDETNKAMLTATRKSMVTLKEELEAALISKEAYEAEITALKDAYKATNEATQKELEKLHNFAIKTSKELKEVKVKGTASTTEKEYVSFTEALREQLESPEIAKQLEIAKGVLEGTANGVNKAVVDMSVTNTIGAGSTQVSITQNTGIISGVRHRKMQYLNSVNVGTATSSKAMWVEETTEQGTAVFVAEAATKTNLSVLYVEKTAPIQKIAVYGKVTTEMIADTPQLVNYVGKNLAARLEVKIEDQLYSGNNAGANLNGVTNVATAFSVTNLTHPITAANEFDVLVGAMAQAEIAFCQTNLIFVHPSTLQGMKGLKAATTNEPLWKEYCDYLSTDNGLSINGARIVATPMVTAGDFLAIDTSVINVLFREGINVRMVASGDDPINNKMTVIVEARLAQFISANDTPGIIKGTFSTAKTALAA